MKFLVTGAQGMLARAMFQHLQAAGDEVTAFTRAELDITTRESVNRTLKDSKPDFVINCAAFTDVDGSEADRDTNYAVNAAGPENLAVECKKIGAGLITVSTDYVFDGTKKGFYTQRDDPNPISEYGKAKLEGERRSQNALARTIVVRVGWLFGAGGKNFLSKVPALLQKGEPINAIADSYGTPTYAPDMAKRLRELAVLDLPGIYHVANPGPGTSFAGFARAAASDANLVNEISASTLRRPAPRPVNSRLRCIMSEFVGLEPLPDWNDALDRFLE